MAQQGVNQHQSRERSAPAHGTAEAMRAAQAERLELILDSIHDYAIFMLDSERRVTTWNEGAARVKGYAADEIIGQHFSVFYTPEDQRRGQPELEQRTAEAEGCCEREGFRVRKNGTWFWGNEIITAIRDYDGRLLGFSKIARDLSARKRTEDALRESEERHRLMVENIRDYAVFTMDPDGRISSWNPGAERVFGYSDGEIIGRNGAILYTPEDRAEGVYEKELATALSDGRALDERWQMRKGGQWFWASGITTTLRDAAGGLRGFVKIARDQTDAKQVEERRERVLEQEKIARLEAEQAIMMKDEFIAVVSHELRTPLTAILLWAKMLRAGTVKPGDQRRVIETIEQSAVAQQQLIEDLLDVSRMMSGKLRLHVREVDAAPVVQAAVDTVRPMAEAKRLAVQVTLDERAGRVRADPDRLQQVVWNILNNAVKFTSPGGRITVSLRRLNGDVRIEVADTGRGIRPDFLPHVFERFRQAEASTTRTHGGLGLGLPSAGNWSSCTAARSASRAPARVRARRSRSTCRSRTCGWRGRRRRPPRRRSPTTPERPTCRRRCCAASACCWSRMMRALAPRSSACSSSARPR